VEYHRLINVEGIEVFSVCLAVLVILASLEFLVSLINVVSLVKFVAFVPRMSFCCSVSGDELKHTKVSDKTLAPKAAVGDGWRKDVDNVEEGALLSRPD
jgi:hypothetical protein